MTENKTLYDHGSNDAAIRRFTTSPENVEAALSGLYEYAWNDFDKNVRHMRNHYVKTHQSEIESRLRETWKAIMITEMAAAQNYEELFTDEELTMIHNEVCKPWVDGVTREHVKRSRKETTTNICQTLQLRPPMRRNYWYSLN